MFWILQTTGKEKKRSPKLYFDSFLKDLLSKVSIGRYVHSPHRGWKVPKELSKEVIVEVTVKRHRGTAQGK